jgi:hypothetical protein
MFDSLFGAKSVEKKEVNVPVIEPSGEGGFRTDRHNNPTAMTTDVAATLGLKAGVDYEQGDPFSNGQFFTAKLKGDGVATTIKGLDNAVTSGISPFYTKSGQQRWNHTALSDDEWKNMTYDQKKQVVLDMYKNEGGSGTFNTSDIVPQGTKSTKKSLFSNLFSGKPAAASIVDKTMKESKAPFKIEGAVLKQGEAKGFEMPTYDSSTKELQPAKFNITSKDNGLIRAAKTAFNAPSAAITNLSNRIGDVFNLMGSDNIKLSDYNKIALASPADREKLTEELKIKVPEKIAAAAAVVPAAINMIPSFMAFQTSLEMAKTANIPIITPVAKASDWVFEKVGSGLATVGSKTVDVLPISQEAKDTLRQPVADLFASLGMIAAFKVGGKIAETGGKGLLEKTGVKPETQVKVSGAVKAATAFGMDPLGTVLKVTTGRIKAAVIDRVAKRQAEGVDITPEESLKIVNEVSKEIPAELPGMMQIGEGENKVNLVTNQRLVLENLIKGQEDITYKRVNNLGKDLNGNQIGARFEWDYRTRRQRYTRPTRRRRLTWRTNLGIISTIRRLRAWKHVLATYCLRTGRIREKLRHPWQGMQ